MLIQNAVLSVIVAENGSFDFKFRKNGSIVSYYRIPRGEYKTGENNLHFGSGANFPLEADSIEISSSFVYSVASLVVNGNMRIEIPVNATKTVSLSSISFVKVLMIAGGGYIAFRVLKSLFKRA